MKKQSSLVSRSAAHYSPLLMGVSLLAMLSACDMLDVTNPFADRRPKQVVSGSRHVPVMNKEALAQMTQAGAPTQPVIAASTPPIAAAPPPPVMAAPPPPPSAPVAPHKAAESIDSNPYDYYDTSGNQIPQKAEGKPASSSSGNFFSRLFGKSDPARKPIPGNPSASGDTSQTAPSPPAPQSNGPSASTVQTPQPVAADLPEAPLLAPAQPAVELAKEPTPDAAASAASQETAPAAPSWFERNFGPIKTTEPTNKTTEPVKTDAEPMSDATPIPAQPETAHADAITPPPQEEPQAPAAPSWFERHIGKMQNESSVPVAADAAPQPAAPLAGNAPAETTLADATPQPEAQATAPSSWFDRQLSNPNADAPASVSIAADAMPEPAISPADNAQPTLRQPVETVLADNSSLPVTPDAAPVASPTNGQPLIPADAPATPAPAPGGSSWRMPSFLTHLFGSDNATKPAATKTDAAQDAAISAEGRKPYPALSSVPPTPPAFQTLKEGEKNQVQELQSDHTAALQEKSRLDREPSQQQPLTPIVLPAPADAAPVPVAADAVPPTAPATDSTAEPVLLGHAAAPLQVPPTLNAPLAGPQPVSPVPSENASPAVAPENLPSAIGQPMKDAILPPSEPIAAPLPAAEAAQQAPLPVAPAQPDIAPLPDIMPTAAPSTAVSTGDAGGLPSPQILQDRKMLPPSRYTTRDQAVQAPDGAQ